MTQHTGVYPYICVTCERGFIQKTRLADHCQRYGPDHVPIRLNGEIVINMLYNEGRIFDDPADPDLIRIQAENAQ